MQSRYSKEQIHKQVHGGLINDIRALSVCVSWPITISSGIESKNRWELEVVGSQVECKQKIHTTINVALSAFWRTTCSLNTPLMELLRKSTHYLLAERCRGEANNYSLIISYNSTIYSCTKVDNTVRAGSCDFFLTRLWGLRFILHNRL